jgi:hypothetical protein
MAAERYETWITVRSNAVKSGFMALGAWLIHF